MIGIFALREIPFLLHSDQMIQYLLD
jgi:hypothetical protein